VGAVAANELSLADPYTVPTRHRHRPADGRQECEWFLGHLGPDVPLQFTAFHPDFKMRDVPPTPPPRLKRCDLCATRGIVAGNALRHLKFASNWPICSPPRSRA
jgi:pyruvate-formate lyase-activating enzyme